MQTVDGNQEINLEWPKEPRPQKLTFPCISHSYYKSAAIANFSNVKIIIRIFSLNLKVHLNLAHSFMHWLASYVATKFVRTMH